MTEQKIIVIDKDLEALRKEIRELWDDRRNNERTLKQKIKEAAARLENKYLEANQIDQISKICSTLMKWYDTGGDESLGRYVELVLDKRYKRVYNRNTINHSDFGFEECKANAERFIEQLEELKKNDFFSMDRGGAQDVSQLLYSLKNKIEDWADEASIPLPYQKDSIGGDKKIKKISLKVALESNDEMIKLLSGYYKNVLKSVMEEFADLKEDIEERFYVSDNPEVLQRMIVGLHATKMLLKPYHDKKWQRDWRQWCDIIEEYYEAGGTRASGFSETEVTGATNKKTGKPERRKVTKEQIDAKYIPYLNDMRFMLLNHPNTIESPVIKNVEYGIDLETGEVKIVKGRPLVREQLEILYPEILDGMRNLIDNWTWLSAISQNYADKEEGLRAERAYELHDILSDAA